MKWLTTSRKNKHWRRPPYVYLLLLCEISEQMGREDAKNAHTDCSIFFFFDFFFFELLESYLCFSWGKNKGEKRAKRLQGKPPAEEHWGQRRWKSKVLIISFNAPPQGELIPEDTQGKKKLTATTHLLKVNFHHEFLRKLSELQLTLGLRRRSVFCSSNNVHTGSHRRKEDNFLPETANWGAKIVFGVYAVFEHLKTSLSGEEWRSEESRGEERRVEVIRRVKKTTWERRGVKLWSQVSVFMRSHDGAIDH